MKLILVFSYKYDYQLVPDLLKNVEDFIDDYVAWDDSESKELWSHEGEIRSRLIKEAENKGADWILSMDPDERLEKSAGKQIRALIKKKDKIIYGFNFREMWTSEKYRVDGLWGEKCRYNLFPVFSGQKFMNLPVHQPRHPINEDYELKRVDINLYHLKMIDPKNREDRKKLFNSLDPKKEIQAIGYDYLTDESGLRLEKVPIGREFTPKYKEEYNIKQF